MFLSHTNSRVLEQVHATHSVQSSGQNSPSGRFFGDVHPDARKKASPILFADPKGFPQPKQAPDRKWDPTTDVDVFKIGSGEVLARFLHTGGNSPQS